MTKILEIESNQSITEILKESDCEFHKIITPEGIVWFPKGINPDRVYGEKSGMEWPYSTVMAAIIAQKVTSGQSLVTIAKEPGLPPYSEILKWKRKPEFAAMLKQAYRDKAEFAAEKAISLSADGADKLHIDTLKWSASAENAEKYGQKKTKKIIQTNKIEVEK